MKQLAPFEHTTPAFTCIHFIPSHILKSIAQHTSQSKEWADFWLSRMIRSLQDSLGTDRSKEELECLDKGREEGRRVAREAVGGVGHQNTSRTKPKQNQKRVLNCSCPPLFLCHTFP